MGANLTITARPLTVTATGVNKVYDGTTTATVSLSDNRVSGDVFTVASTGATFADKHVGTGKPVTVAGIALSGTDAGNYTVAATATTTAAITARPVTVTADAQTKGYGVAEPALTYQVTVGSLVSGDSVTGTLTRVAGANVGVYAIQQGTLALTANYTLTFVGANLTITTAYCFNGFLPPIGGAVENVPSNGGSFADPVRAFKLGSTIPIKFALSSLNGSACGAVVTTGVHTLQAIYYSSAADPDPMVIDATPTDAATTGNQFRLAGTEWHYNLSTKGPGFMVGTWLFKATLRDGSVKTVWASIKK